MREQSITKGFAVLSAAGIAVKILSLLYIPFLLAIIGEEGNGIYAAAYQVYVFVYVLANSGIPVAISKLVSELLALNNAKDAVRSFKIARFFMLVLGTVMSVLLLVTAFPLAKALHFEKSGLAILALSPTLLFTSVASAYRGYFQGRGNMIPTAVSQVIEQIINTIFTLVFAALLMRVGLEAACAGGTVGTSLGALVAAIYLVWYHNKHKKDINVSNPPGVKRYSYKQLVKKIVGYSVPITLTVGLTYAGNLVDLWNTKARLLAAGFADERATELYSYLYKYQQLMNAPIAVIVALAAAMLPAISGAVALKDRERLQNRIDYAFKLCFLVAVPSVIGFSVLSGPIFHILKYGEGSYLMFFGSFVLLLMSVVQIQNTVLQGSGRLYFVTFNLLLGIIFKISINYFFISIPDINIKGAILGSTGGFLIPLILNTLLIKASTGVKLNFPGYASKPILASGIMGITVYGVHKGIFQIMAIISTGYFSNAFATIVSILIGACVYFCTLVFVKGISMEVLGFLPGRILKLIPPQIMGRIK